MKTIQTTIENRLIRVERSMARWKGLAMGLLAVGAAASLIGAGSGSTEQIADINAIAVEQGGFAVIQIHDGSWQVIHERGVDNFRMVSPSNN